MINYNHPKTVIFFSNPFGYGPTGTLVPIAKKFNDSLGNTQFIFASSGLCNEILDRQQLGKFHFYEIDQRNLADITAFIQRFTPPPFVVSSLNRFAIQAAHNLGLTSALVDPLGWFWRPNQRPVEYDLTDYYFYNGLGQKKYPGRKCFNISPITDNIRPSSKISSESSIVIHLGGTQSPFVSGIPKEYLDLVARLVNDTPFELKEKIIIAGGAASMEYLNRSITKKVICRSFSFDEFIEKICQCRKIFTPAGMGATFISIYLKKDLNIFLPHNLSQWALARTPVIKKLAHTIFSWEDYSPLDWESREITEKESIDTISKLSLEVIRNKSLYRKLQENFSSCVSAPNGPLNKSSQIHLKGQDFIFRKLVAKWHLS